MTKVCVCDRCRVPVAEGAFTMSGWWHLVTESRKSRPAVPTNEKISADICQECVGEMNLRMNLAPTRHELFERWMKDNPNRSGLEGLRKTAFAYEYIENAFCDCCKEVCSDRYARLISNWLTENQENLYADLCPSCFEVLELPNESPESEGFSI